MAIKLNAATGGGSVALDAPNATTSNANVVLTLPVDDGTSGQYLQTNGTGTLSWQTVTTPTVIEASGYLEGNGGSATADTIIASFTSLDFSNYAGNLLQVFGRTTAQENSNYADAAVLYVEITNGTNTAQIAGSRNGAPYGGFDGNQQFDISTSSLYTIPSTYATTGITLRLRVNVQSSSGVNPYTWGDQPNSVAFDNIGSGINGGYGFQYIVFG